MHTEPRGQGGLPWHLRLNDLLGRARTCVCTDVGSRAAATLSRRLHGIGQLDQSVRERRNDELTIERNDEERWLCVARST